MCIEKIDNIRLIKDNLNHIRLELLEINPYYFRIAKESHHILYRSMIEALRGTANLQITYNKKEKRKHTHYYKIDNAPWVKIQKVKISNCKFAWRFTEPIKCDPPENISDSNWDEISHEEFLIDFYEALAMIQSECFMKKYYMSKMVSISDLEMRNLEWLHIRVRNSFEHFIPSTWIIGKIELLDVSLLCLTLSKELLFESQNIIYHQSMSDLSDSINYSIIKLNEIRKK